MGELSGVIDHKYAACLFDMDGVLTDTASVHAAAWKKTFDEILLARGGAQFDITSDYNLYVDGKPRSDGVRDFLSSRDIELPEGRPDDPPTAHTVWGVGNHKNELLLDMLRRQGVRVYDDAVTLVRCVRNMGIRTAVVSASANTLAVLEAAAIDSLFDVRVDGVMVIERNLRGKPAPDTFLAAAQELGIEAAEAVVFEDALSGVEAGRAGGFGLVVGVDRVGHAQDLLAHGADFAVANLTELLPA